MISVTGVEEVRQALRKLGVNFAEGVDKGVFITAQDVRTTAVKSIQAQTSGTLVQRSRQGGRGTYTHMASAPNSAPNTDTGKLVSSIAVEKQKDADYLVGSNLDYSEFLEFGTTKMDARPWLIPAMDANRSNLNGNIVKVCGEIIKKAQK